MSDKSVDYRTRLRELRSQSGLTQIELADQIGRFAGKSVSKAQVGSWERLESNPSVQEFSALCDAMSVSAHWLLFGEGPKDRGRLVQGLCLGAGEPVIDDDLRRLAELVSPALLRRALDMSWTINESNQRLIDELEALLGRSLTDDEREQIERVAIDVQEAAFKDIRENPHRWGMSIESTREDRE